MEIKKDTKKKLRFNYFLNTIAFIWSLFFSVACLSIGLLFSNEVLIISFIPATWFLVSAYFHKLENQQIKLLLEFREFAERGRYE